MPKDYYEVLGLSRGASADDIKKAYRKLSKELHPDKHSSTGSGEAKKEAERKFKEVNEAYEVLSNPQKKQMYDQFGTAGNGAGGFNPGAGFSGGFGGFDFSSFTGGDAGNFSDLFESFFGGGRSRAQEREQGDDKELTVTIPFLESVTGARKTFSIRTFVTCDHCNGSGAEKGSAVVTCKECGGTGQVTRTAQSFFGTIQQRTLCPVCRGSGKVPEKPCSQCRGEGRLQRSHEVVVDIPPGIDDGQRLRLRGQGDAGRQGSAAGDLYVQVRVQPDKRFRREGDDVHTELTVFALDAILGAERPVETVHGPVMLKIPEGTQPDQVLRIKGKGMPVLNTSRHGDQYVTVKVEIPKKLSREERKILEEWHKLIIEN